MKKLFLLIFIISAGLSESISDKTKNMKKLPGYFNMYWDKTSGKRWIEIKDFVK